MEIAAVIHVQMLKSGANGVGLYPFVPQGASPGGAPGQGWSNNPTKGLRQLAPGKKCKEGTCSFDHAGNCWSSALFKGTVSRRIWENTSLLKEDRGRSPEARGEARHRFRAAASAHGQEREEGGCRGDGAGSGCRPSASGQHDVLLRWLWSAERRRGARGAGARAPGERRLVGVVQRHGGAERRRRHRRGAGGCNYGTGAGRG